MVFCLRASKNSRKLSFHNCQCWHLKSHWQIQGHFCFILKYIELKPAKAFVLWRETTIKTWLHRIMNQSFTLKHLENDLIFQITTLWWIILLIVLYKRVLWSIPVKCTWFLPVVWSNAVVYLFAAWVSIRSRLRARWFTVTIERSVVTKEKILVYVQV